VETSCGSSDVSVGRCEVVVQNALIVEDSV
jgi:hypothetical protein